MIRHLNFNNRNRGKQPRAHILLRAGRLLRRKRVAYARFGAAHALKVAQQELDRVYQLARAHDVPLADVGPMPRLPELPGQDWVEFLRSMGATKPVVKAAPAQPTNAPQSA